jgi:antitoxin ParD1/3/4
VKALAAPFSGLNFARALTKPYNQERPARRGMDNHDREHKPMSIPLTPEIEQIIQEKVQSGRYLSASEVVREALRLLEERDRLHQLRLEELRKEIAVGIEQADRGELLDGAEVFRRLREKFPEIPEQGS